MESNKTLKQTKLKEYHMKTHRDYTCAASSQVRFGFSAISLVGSLKAESVNLAFKTFIETILYINLTARHSPLDFFLIK